MTINTIIEYKNELQRIISTTLDTTEAAKAIGSKYKKFAIKYHPDKFGQKKFNNYPYVSQIWNLLKDSNDLPRNAEFSFTSYDEKIRKYRSSELLWDKEEDGLNLGPIKERIQKVREEESKDITRKINSANRKEEEKIRKEKSIKRKEEEEKIRKEKSIKRKEEEEKIRKEKSIKRKEEEEKIRKEKSIKRKEEEANRQDSLNRKFQRKNESISSRSKMDVVNDNDVYYFTNNNTRKSKKSMNHTITNRSKRHRERRNERINNFMNNKTVKRRDLIDLLRNRHEKMDVVNDYELPRKFYRNKTQKRKSALDRIREFK
jgi:hypothetical protein